MIIFIQIYGLTADILSNNCVNFSNPAASSFKGLRIRTTLVGFLVYAAAPKSYKCFEPNSILLLTKQYGIPFSSQNTGRCEITSTGLTSAAKIQILDLNKFDIPFRLFSDSFCYLLDSSF